MRRSDRDRHARFTERDATGAMHDRDAQRPPAFRSFGGDRLEVGAREFHVRFVIERFDRPVAPGDVSRVVPRNVQIAAVRGIADRGDHRGEVDRVRTDPDHPPPTGGSSAISSPSDTRVAPSTITPLRANRVDARIRTASGDEAVNDVHNVFERSRGPDFQAAFAEAEQFAQACERQHAQRHQKPPRSVV